LNNTVSTVEAQMSALQADLKEAEERLQAVATQVEAFDGFLLDMRDVLLTVKPLPTATPTRTPTRTRTPTVMPRGTETPTRGAPHHANAHGDTDAVSFDQDLTVL